MMWRREFLTLVSGAAAVWPMAARAQQAATIPVVGLLGGFSPAGGAQTLRAFRQGLSDTGYRPIGTSNSTSSYLA